MNNVRFVYRGLSLVTAYQWLLFLFILAGTVQGHAVTSSAENEQAYQSLLNLDHRPSIAEVKEAFGDRIYQQGFFEGISSQVRSQLGTFAVSGSIDTIAPAIIAAFEKAYPGGTYLGMGRDSSLLTDILDSFYQSLGQEGRVLSVELGRGSFGDEILIEQYLKQKGFDPANLATSSFVVPFDATRFTEHSQSRLLLGVMKRMCLASAKCDANLFASKVGFLNTGFKKGMYPTNLYTGGETDELLRALVEKNVDMGDVVAAISIDVPNNLTYTLEYHGSYEGFVKKNQGVEPIRGPLAESSVRRAIIDKQIEIIRATSSPEFRKKVFEVAKSKFGYDFPLERLTSENSIRQIRGFMRPQMPVQTIHEFKSEIQIALMGLSMDQSRSLEFEKVLERWFNNKLSALQSNVSKEIVKELAGKFTHYAKPLTITETQMLQQIFDISALGETIVSLMSEKVLPIESGWWLLKKYCLGIEGDLAKLFFDPRFRLKWESISQSEHVSLEPKSFSVFGSKDVYDYLLLMALVGPDFWKQHQSTRPIEGLEFQIARYFDFGFNKQIRKNSPYLSTIAKIHARLEGLDLDDAYVKVGTLYIKSISEISDSEFRVESLDEIIKLIYGNNDIHDRPQVLAKIITEMKISNKNTGDKIILFSQRWSDFFKINDSYWSQHLPDFLKLMDRLLVGGAIDVDAYAEALSFQVDLGSSRKFAILRQYLNKMGQKEIPKVSLDENRPEGWMQKIIIAALVSEPVESKWIESIIDVWLNSVSSMGPESDVHHFHETLLKQLQQFANFNLMSESRKLDFIIQLIKLSDQRRSGGLVLASQNAIETFEKTALQMYSLKQTQQSLSLLGETDRQSLLTKAVDAAKSLKSVHGILPFYEENVLLPLLEGVNLDSSALKDYRKFVIESYLEGKLGEKEWPQSLNSKQSPIYNRLENSILIESEFIVRLNQFNMVDSAEALLNWSRLGPEMDSALLRAWMQAKRSLIQETSTEGLILAFKKIEESRKFVPELLIEVYSESLKSRNQRVESEEEMNIMRKFANKSSAFTKAWSLDSQRGPLHQPGFCRMALSKLFGSTK